MPNLSITRIVIFAPRPDEDYNIIRVIESLGNFKKNSLKIYLPFKNGLTTKESLNYSNAWEILLAVTIRFYQYFLKLTRFPATIILQYLTYLSLADIAMHHIFARLYPSDSFIFCFFCVCFFLSRDLEPSSDSMAYDILTP